MYTKDDVAKLVEDIGKIKMEPGLEVGEVFMFGLALDVFDPVSGQVITVARPHRSDVGAPEILLTAEQLATAISQARTSRLQSDKAKGVVTEEEKAAAAEAQPKALAAKNARLEKEGKEPSPPAPAPARDPAPEHHMTRKEQAAHDKAERAHQ